MLRPIVKADLPQLLCIEQAAHAVPWTDETFKTCFEAGHIGWVIELNRDDQNKGRRIVGFTLVSVRMEECHILNLCVAREHQHQGYGRQLLEHAMRSAKDLGASVVYLEVRRTNTRAIELYKNAQFILIGERKDYYPTVSGNEDALVFARSLAVSLTAPSKKHGSG